MVRVWVLSLATLVVACAMTHGRAGVQAAASVVRPIDGTDSDLALATRFRATVRIVAEQVDKGQDYPPWLRLIDLAYDFDEGRARLVIKEGYEKGKTYIRRYDQDREYMTKGGNYAACERAYLGEEMPAPVLPDTAVLQGDAVVNGVECYHWVDRNFNDLVQIYVSKATRAPVRLEESWLDESGVETKLMTYEFVDVDTSSIPESTFQLPEPWTHDTCTRNQAGFPYLHLFHHYLRV